VGKDYYYDRTQCGQKKRAAYAALFFVGLTIRPEPSYFLDFFLAFFLAFFFFFAAIANLQREQLLLT